MIWRVIVLEWLKLKHYRVFWILLAMYLLALLCITSLGVFLLEWLKSKGAEFNGIDPTIVPIYDFPDIWQNTTYLGSFVKMLLAFIVIISVNNDISYLTMRQNIIDGISKREFLLSKFFLIISLGVISSLFLFFTGIINGAIYSHVWGAKYIFDELEFLLAYFYQIVVFGAFAFLLSILIKKAGFVIVFIFLYSVMFEPLATTIMENVPQLQDTWAPNVAALMPVNAINGLIPLPFGRYIFQEIVDNVPLSNFLISTAWLGIFTGLIVYILNKRDLK
jgi:ABC-type transport system involved in multi-copper enzyme maturation permease subunit